MHPSKILPIFTLAITALAAVDLPLANPPQRRSLKKFTLAKRQAGGDSVGIGASCSAITGNAEDVICEISGENVSCAPVCCERDGVFVDGCPAGDQCVFENESLKCCPIGKKCGTRPTACANFGALTTQSGQAICPSATPTCTTRTDGAIACAGSGDVVPTVPPASTQTNGSGGRFFIRPNGPNPTEAVATPEPSSSMVSEDEGGMQTTSGGDGDGDDDDNVVEETRMGMPSGTLVLPESAMPTDEGAAVNAVSVPGGAGDVVCDHVFGVVVAVVVGLGLFL
ncbi:hypothetical protein TWF506_004658 [Arthrobotrys conoides]|uniref:GPI anchored protein n=1 Tax=Arthrobotrys conoides TaxID=74498 RepID=A0AAN8N9R0_9PEZI